MRLLTVTTSWPRSAADPSGRFVRELHGYLSTRGWDGPAVSLYAPSHGALQAWNTGHRRSLVRPLGRFAVDIFRAARNCDAVLAHWTVPSGVLASLTGLPTIGVAHGGDVRLLRHQLLARSVTRMLCGVIAVSERCAKPFTTVPTLVTPMGVDTSRFDGMARTPGPVKRVLFVGRLVPIKGIQVVLEAAQTLPLDITVAGAGPLQRTLEAQFPHAHWMGAVSPEEIPGLMQNHDLLVVPSVGMEGSPVVVAEACAAGLPVLSSDIGGLQQMVPDRMRVPPGDVRAWRNRLVELHTGHGKATLVGERDRFGWNLIADKISHFLDDVLLPQVSG